MGSYDDNGRQWRKSVTEMKRHLSDSALPSCKLEYHLNVLSCVAARR